MILWFYDKWGRGGPKYEVLIIDNHCAPSHSEGVWKKNQNWSIIKGWQGVQRDLVQTTFLSEWQGGTVPETWPVSVVLWPGLAPSHKLCEQDLHWMEKLGHIFSSHIIRLHIARIRKLYLLASWLSISLAPITHFLLNLLTRSSCIAYWLTLSRTVDLVHCTFSSARIRGSEKDSHCPIVRFASW